MINAEGWFMQEAEQGRNLVMTRKWFMQESGPGRKYVLADSWLCYAWESIELYLCQIKDAVNSFILRLIALQILN